MKFGLLQKQYFNADEGAYSVVTFDERDNSQITITEGDGESDILISVIGEDKIPRKAARSTKTDLFLWEAGGAIKPIQLTVNFPKTKGRELRIYRNKNQGFGYEEGDVWFVFRRGKRLFVGSLPEPVWRSIGRLDEEDEAYTAMIYEPEEAAANPRLVKALQYPRDRRKALLVFEAAGYKCEVEPSIPLFTARRTGKPYLEPHHLIPMSLQKSFHGKNLDHQDNIYALSPHHHRRVHLGTPEDSHSIVDLLLARRSHVLKRFWVKAEDILGFYNCLKIV
jgi:5-methylcytosine-specific restriction protein A